MKFSFETFLLLAGIAATSPSYSGLVEYSHAWNADAGLRICWAPVYDLESPESFVKPKDKTLIGDLGESKKSAQLIGRFAQVAQETLSRELTKADTGISVKTFEKCPARPDRDVADIVVLFASSKKGLPFDLEGGTSSSIGDPGRIPSYVLLNIPEARGSSKTSAEVSMQILLLHEIGHVLGLRHEQAHSGLANTELGKGMLGVSENIDDGHETSQFDVNSIMYYYFEGTIRSTLTDAFKVKNGHFYVNGKKIKPADKMARLALLDFKLLDDRILMQEFDAQGFTRVRYQPGYSKGDRHALRCIYAKTPAERDSVCTSKFDPYL